MISQIVFVVALGIATYFFARNASRIRRNILLGKKKNMNDQPGRRWKTMARVALGQGKMGTRPLAAFFHLIIYAGFILINLEVLEILLDGLLNKHRILLPLLGSFYGVVIGFFEILALGVLAACLVFLFRRVVVKVPRLSGSELAGWPQKDAVSILLIETVLMSALLFMNAADHQLQNSFSMPISSWLSPLLGGMSESQLHLFERIAWWAHIIGIFLFLNYLPFSKHLHIILAFPNTWYSRLEPKGYVAADASITTEVSLMMDPSATPPQGYEPPTGFGVKDIQDLSWKNLLDAYTCTECGRCTSVCPANLTGKKLSPRNIMMQTRDRVEQVGNRLDQGLDIADGTNLHSLISAEELWACTTCNACVEICPVNISPVEIIHGMRQYLVMEESSAPTPLNNMFGNLENNGAPWPFSPSDRANWRND